MKTIADICIIPLGVGVSVSSYIAECERILRDTGLIVRLHAYGTNVEGEWNQVMLALKLCHQRLHEMGIPRISTSLRIGTRTDRTQSMEDKIHSVETKIRVYNGKSEEPTGDDS